MKKVPEKLYIVKYHFANDWEWMFAIRQDVHNFPSLWRDITYAEIDVKDINRKAG